MRIDRNSRAGLDQYLVENCNKSETLIYILSKSAKNTFCILLLQYLFYHNIDFSNILWTMDIYVSIVQFYKSDLQYTNNRTCMAYMYYILCAIIDLLDPVIMVNYHDHDDLSYISNTVSPNHESHYRTYVNTVEVTRLLSNRGIPKRKPVTMTHKDPDRVRKRTQSVDCPCGDQVNILIIHRSRVNFLIVFYDDASKTTSAILQQN